MACTDGATPRGGLIMDSVGNLYGTTVTGSNSGAGTVFELTPNAVKTKWTEKVLYSFALPGHPLDGEGPDAGLIMDRDGNLYGMTEAGGTSLCCGTVFELTPNRSKTAWTKTILYNFCTQGGGDCTDGANPLSGLIMDKAGNLYGTTWLGGGRSSNFSGGTAFELTPNSARTKWTEKVLHRFCSRTHCTDGLDPQAGLLIDAAGRLYGTTRDGGAYPGITGDGAGTVFALRPNGNRTVWTEDVLYRFCEKSCFFDAFPTASLIMDGSGALYGTTLSGAVFRLALDASRMIWSETVLHLLCGPGPPCPSSAPLIRDADGNLYGTTFGGPPHAGGMIFELSRNVTTWTEAILYGFCRKGGDACTDGVTPYAGLIMDDSGSLYGTTSAGGLNNHGTVFELTR